MISGYIIGDKALVARLVNAPEAVKRELDQTVQKLGFALEARVVQTKLSGQVLKRRTGRLAASITTGAAETKSRFESTSLTAFAYVGTNVSYGRAWELGFTRRVGAGARGGPNLTGKSLATYFAKHPPGTKSYAARPFLKPALQEMRPVIIEQITLAAKRGMAAALKS